MFVVLLPTASLRAEGMVQTLADDGVAAVFDFKQEGDMAGERFSLTGTARLAFVGTQAVAGLKCRWLELELEYSLTVDDEKTSQRALTKLLVPEQDLIHHDDPLARAIKIYSMQSPSEDLRLITGKEARRMELWSLGTYFPKSPTKSNRLNRELSSQLIETPAGKFECDVHAFDNFVDQYLLGPSRVQECRIHRIWKNPASPFGVVAMNVHSEAQQVSIPDASFAGDSERMTRGSLSMVTEFRLRDIEKDATSRFPDVK